jgi:dihydrofolate synthase/folylpolyglutamate synthase
MLNSYQAAIDWLFKQFPSYQKIGAPAYKPGLDRVFCLLNDLGNPENELKFIHVAGTNGKGSTCSYLASYLTETGEKVGLFTSPHIYDFRERIRINGNQISEEFVVSFCNKIIESKLEISPSFFELTFAMALAYFNQEACSICVIETGLGGRLDATNVIKPLVSIITNIGFDHTQFLGNTYSEIATEKAGIIKERIPVIIGETNPETKNVFLEVSKNKNAEIHLAENKQLPSGINLPLYQQKNLRLARKALEIIGFQVDSEILNRSLTHLHINTGYFGRLTKIQEEPRIFIDVSHNKEGLMATIESISNSLDGQLHILFGASSDKNVEEMLACFPVNSIIHLCTFKNERSLSLSQLEELKKSDSRVQTIFNDINNGLSEISGQTQKKDTLLVTGSFFLISDINRNKFLNFKK